MCPFHPPTEKPDLSSGTYDALETMLSRKLDIKVILIRDWQVPEEYYRADRDRWGQYAGSPELKAAQEKFEKVEAATMASLRDYLVTRDPDVGHALADNDLRSLLNVSHVTPRSGNTEPEQAVIVFDPAGRWQLSEYDTDPGLNFALEQRCWNSWVTMHAMRDQNWDFEKNPEEIRIRNIIENFSLDMEDIRCYDAMHRIRFALQNQNEYDRLGRRSRDARYYKFADLTPLLGHDSAQMWKLPETPEAARRKYGFEEYERGDYWDMKDPDFFKNVRLAGAIQNLVHYNSPPFETIARLGFADAVSWKQTHEIQKGLKGRLKQQLEKHRPHDDVAEPLTDWRVLFPLFREIYEKDKSEGPMREFLDTIMEGLQKWFPTITNAPVPKLEPGHEPPRKIGGTAPKITPPKGPQP